MIAFHDQDAAERAKERLEELTAAELQPLFDHAFDLCPNPDLALTNLERWLRAVSNPKTYAQQLTETPDLAKQLMIVGSFFGSNFCKKKWLWRKIGIKLNSPLILLIPQI